MSATSPHVYTFGKESSAIWRVGLTLIWPVGEMELGERLAITSESGLCPVQFIYHPIVD